MIYSIELEDLLKDTNIYSVHSFKDLVSPTSTYDQDFAELCEVYLDLYKLGYKFVKYSPSVSDAQSDVIALATDSLLEGLIDDLATDIEIALDLDVVDTAVSDTSASLTVFSQNDQNILVKIYPEGAMFDEDMELFMIPKLTVSIKSGLATKDVMIDCRTQDFSSVVDLILRIVKK